MAATTIANLWTPQQWLEEMAEKQATFPSIVQSGAVVTNPELVAAASGAGVSVKIPFWKDNTDQADAIQVEGTAPTVNNLTAGTMIAPVLNRVSATGATALSGQVAGTDPVGRITDILTQTRAKQRQTTLIAILRGIFGTLDQTPDEAEGSFRANRMDYFLEDGGTPLAANLFDVDMFIDATALLGELADDLVGGVMMIHPTVLAALKKADDVSSFKEVSMGAFTITMYRGLQIIQSSALRRAGATTGYVYETYLAVTGALGFGSKPQAADSIDVASLQMDVDKAKNDTYIYDRNRFLLHPTGAIWGGSPSGQSATNAELATATNWTLGLTSVARSGMVAVRTNG